MISKEVGGHEIIIRGQIPDYIGKIGSTYDIPLKFIKNKKMMGGYSVPVNQAQYVEEAFSNCGKRFKERIIMNGTATYFFNI